MVRRIPNFAIICASYLLEGPKFPAGVGGIRRVVFAVNRALLRALPPKRPYRSEGRPRGNALNRRRFTAKTTLRISDRLNSPGLMGRKRKLLRNSEFHGPVFKCDYRENDHPIRFGPPQTLLEGRFGGKSRPIEGVTAKTTFTGEIKAIRNSEGRFRGNRT